jgi:hypothetical protein
MVKIYRAIVRYCENGVFIWVRRWRTGGLCLIVPSKRRVLCHQLLLFDSANIPHLALSLFLCRCALSLPRLRRVPAFPVHSDTLLHRERARGLGCKVLSWAMAVLLVCISSYYFQLWIVSRTKCPVSSCTPRLGNLLLGKHVLASSTPTLSSFSRCPSLLRPSLLSDLHQLHYGLSCLLRPDFSFSLLL